MFDFEKKMFSAFGQSPRSMRMTTSGRPQMSLLEFPDGGPFEVYVMSSTEESAASDVAEGEEDAFQDLDEDLVEILKQSAPPKLQEEKKKNVGEVDLESRSEETSHHWTSSESEFQEPESEEAESFSENDEGETFWTNLRKGSKHHLRRNLEELKGMTSTVKKNSPTEVRQRTPAEKKSTGWSFLGVFMLCMKLYQVGHDRGWMCHQPIEKNWSWQDGEAHFANSKPDILMLDLRETMIDPWWKNADELTPHDLRMRQEQMNSKSRWNESLGRIMQEQLDTGRGVLVLMPETSVPYVLSPGQELKTVLRLNQSNLKTNMSLNGVTNISTLFKSMEVWLSTNSKENLIFQEGEETRNHEP